MNYVKQIQQQRSIETAQKEHHTQLFTFVGSAVYTFPHTQHKVFLIKYLLVTKKMITNILQFFFLKKPVVFFAFIFSWFHGHHVSWRPMVLLEAPKTPGVVEHVSFQSQ